MGVDRLVVDLEGEVKVGAGYPSGVTNGADRGARADPLADPDGYLVEVAIDRLYSKIVIDLDVVSIKRVPACPVDFPLLGRNH